MIFNQDLLFVHIGKTGGRSCARLLMQCLRPPVYNCHCGSRVEMRRLSNWLLRRRVLARSDIARHCTLAEAAFYLQQNFGRDLASFRKVIAVIRHPFTLEYSFYRHLQKPEVRRRKAAKPALLKLADSDFENFVANAQYHREGHPQEAFFLVDGLMLPQVELVRFENLSTDFPEVVRPFALDTGVPKLPHLGMGLRDEGVDRHLTPNVIELLYHKHRYMFDSGLYSLDFDSSGTG